MKPLSGFLGLLLLAPGARLAQADTLISYQINGGAVITCTVGVDMLFIPCGPSNIGAGVVLSVDAAGTSGISTSLLDATVSIMNTGGATDRLLIWISAQDFLAPTTPPNVGFSSTLSTTSTAGAGTTEMESCIDQANGLAPPLCSVPAGTLTNPVEVYSGVSFETNTVTSTISSLTAPYSIAEEITIVLGPGTILPVTTSLSVTSVPEPMSITLLGGVVLLTLRAIRRKRNQEASRV